MNNLYLIESDNYDTISLKVRDILKDNNLSTDNLITYDLEEVNVSEAIIDLDTYSLFNEKKVVFGKNATFLSTGKTEIEHDIELFEKFINNPNDNILIISCNKLDGKKNIVKLVKEKFKLVNCNIDITDYIKEKTKGYKISSETLRYFIINMNDDIAHINNELDKLMFLCEDTKEITKEDIDLVVIKKVDNNIFDLIDAIISKNKEKSLKIYESMTNYGEDVFKIFVSLSNQIRLIYQVKVLKNMSNEDIASKLHLKNPKQVAALRYKIDKYTTTELLDYLHKLAIMDEELKNGKAIDKIVFPIFIASL